MERLSSECPHCRLTSAAAPLAEAPCNFERGDLVPHPFEDRRIADLLVLLEDKFGLLWLKIP